MQSYEQRIKDLELKISSSYPTEETELREDHKILALLKRFEMAEKLGPVKSVTKIKNKAPIPVRRVYTRNVSPHSRDSIFIAPPFGNLGVLIVNTGEEIPKIGDFIEFLEYKKVVVSGTIVAIEKPGSCIRPDIKRDGWKIHWVPWDQFQVDSYLSNKVKSKRKK